MSEIRVDVYRSIPFQIEAVNTCLLDFERAQPRLIAGIFDDYAVLSGGIGEGTVVSCGMTVRGRLRPFEFRISEPIPSKIITGYDHDSRFAITWRLRAEGAATEVEIEVYWSEPDSAFGFVTAWWANIVVRRMLKQVLARLPEVIVELGYDIPPPSLPRR
jgi:hypothetical protein